MKRLVECIESITRETDRLGRYGGEEFILLLSQTSPANALRLVERIRKKVARDAAPTLAEKIQVTVSIGLTDIRPPDSLETAIERADRALYGAKKSGRNRVCQA